MTPRRSLTAFLPATSPRRSFVCRRPPVRVQASAGRSAACAVQRWRPHIRPRALIAAASATIGSALAYRSYVQHRDARAFAIRTPNGIDEALFCRVGGIDQWLQIRGEDRDNPILLVLHG